MDTFATTVGPAMQWIMAELARARVGSRWLTDTERDHALRGEAEALLLWLTGWSRARLVSSLSEELPKPVRLRLKEAVAKRCQGLPLQYVMGQAAFYGRLFVVRPGCLIPRPETEILADLAVHWIQRYQPQAIVADVGTGSGILAVTIQLECPQTSVYAIDLSQEALDVAKENVDRLAPVNMHWVHDDGLRWLRGAKAGLSANTRVGADVGGDVDGGSATGTVAGTATENEAEVNADARTGSDTKVNVSADTDTEVNVNVIVSNPPYIPSADVDHLDEEVRMHEPRLALDGGADGLDLYRGLSQLGEAIFAAGPAALFLEVGAGQAEDVLHLFTQGEQGDGRWPGWHFAVEADLRGLGRIVWGERRIKG